MRVEVSVRSVGERGRRVDHWLCARLDRHVGGTLVCGHTRLGEVAVSEVDGEARLLNVVHLAAACVKLLNRCSRTRVVGGPHELELHLAGSCTVRRGVVGLEEGHRKACGCVHQLRPHRPQEEGREEEREEEREE